MQRLVDKLYILLKESTITQSLLVLFIFGPMAYCAITGAGLPEVLVQYGWVILGYFFGSKAGYMLAKGA